MAISRYIQRLSLADFSSAKGRRHRGIRLRRMTNSRSNQQLRDALAIPSPFHRDNPPQPFPARQSGDAAREGSAQRRSHGWKRRHSALWLGILLAPWVLAGNPASSRDDLPPPVEPPRLFELALETREQIDFTGAEWRLRRGDDPAWAGAGLDESGWVPVKVGMGLSAQGHPNAGFYWYRASFSVPAHWKGERDFLLELGRISVFDQVFFNGHEVGHFSNLPPAPPVPGSSGVRRRYLVDPGIVHFGQPNTLAIRVRLGAGSGLYEGPYAFSSLSSDVSVNFALKPRLEADGGNPRDALLHFLTPAAHLNHFHYGNPIRIQPEVVGLSRKLDGREYSLRLRVTDHAGQTVLTKERLFPVFHLRSKSLPITLPLPEEGDFICALEMMDPGGNPVWQKRIPFSRKFRPPPAALAVNPNLRFETPAWNTVHRIHEDSVGHYGGRLLNDQGMLDAGFAGADPRGALTYCSLVDPLNPDILIYQTNNAPPPRRSPRTPSGHRYDGYPDFWPLGFLSIGMESPPQSVEVNADWAKRGYRFTYPAGFSLEFTNSTLSPAWRLRTDSPRIDVFRHLSEWGLGQPMRIAFLSDKGFTVRAADEGIRGREMKENWILAWFHGSRGWNSFDMPWLFVLEKRPERVGTEVDSLSFRFAGPAGRLFGMPLFGVRLPTLFETEHWAEAPSADIMEVCRLWSKSLLLYPEFVERKFAADFAENALTVQDRIHFSRTHDSWSTVPAQHAPLPPTLVLSALSGNLDLEFDHPAVDPGLPTLHGPLLLAEGTDTVRFRVDGLLHYTRQKRTVDDLPVEANEYLRERERLENAVREVFASEPLDQHPWRRSLRRRGVVSGYSADLASHLILALPHLSEDLRSQLSDALREELRRGFLFTGVPDERGRRHVQESFWNRPTILEFTDQLNGLDMAMNARDASRGGLDGIVMEAFRLHAVWQIADALDHWEEIEAHWPLIRKIFNTIPHGHDWAINQSWDHFSGIRIGNGLQESGVIYAGLLGTGRMARRMGDGDLEEYTAYLAAMQLIALNAAATGIHYFRIHRPWSAAHSEAEVMEEVEMKLRERYVEFNEFAGSSQNIINARDDVQNPYSYILWGLPDTKRPYHDIWTEANRYFFEKPRVLGSARRHLLNLTAHAQRADREEVLRRYRESLSPAWQLYPYLGYTGSHPALVDSRVFLETLGRVTWEEEDGMSRQGP